MKKLRRSWQLMLPAVVMLGLLLVLAACSGGKKEVLNEQAPDDLQDVQNRSQPPSSVLRVLSHNLRITVDADGPDDVPAQTDVSQLGFDDSHLLDSGFYVAQMQFDDTAYPGGNSGDGCIFFDSDDAGGFTDFAVCGSFIQNTDTGVVELQSAALYDCKGSEPNNDEGKRCGFTGGGGDGSNGIIAQDLDGDGIFESDGDGNLLVTPYDTTCSLNTTAQDPFNEVGTHNTSGEQDPITDTQLTCIIYADELVELDGDIPSGIAISNACSFTSPDPSSESKDCVVGAGDGFLQIVKNTIGGDETFNFTIDGDPFTSITTVGGTGSTIFLAVPGDTLLNLAEVVPADWQLTNATCDNGDSPSSLTVASATTVVCTFTNQLLNADPAQVTKTNDGNGNGIFTDGLEEPFEVVDPDSYPVTVPYEVEIANNNGYEVLLVSLVDTNESNGAVLPMEDLTCTNSDGTPILVDSEGNPIPVDGNGDGVLDHNLPIAAGSSIICTFNITFDEDAAVLADFDGVLNKIEAGVTRVDSEGNPVGETAFGVDVSLVKFIIDPELSITKTATEQSYSAVGDIINYTIVATNIGNTTLDNVTVTDPGVDGLSCNPANGSTLAPGDSMTCTATHTITQADIDAGNYLNTACVDDGPDGAAEVCDDEDVPADQNPELSITKTATEQSYSAVGDIINYTIVATNIGNTTLDNVTVTDPGVDGLSCNPANGSTLAPGDSMTCTATHTITQADIDAGNYLNTACVDDGPDGAAEVCDDEDVPADQNPELSITKTATEQSYSAVGDIINYTIVATNIGNTTLDNVTVTDPGVDGLSCNPANGSTLAPSDSMTCTATHTITQADIDAGNYLNTACVDDGPDGAAEVCDDEDVPADQNPELSITKTATEQSYSAVGDIINYTIVATNIGNTTLDNVTVTDPGVDGLSCNPANGSTLAPSDSMTCTATHTITQADIDAGNYLNTACVDDGPDGAAEVCDDEDVPADQNPELSITKTATEQSYSAVGDIINYTIVATNIGNTTLDNVTVTDPGVDGLSCNPANGSTLAPSDSMTCTATHTITQADIDAGNYLNTACVDDGPDGAAEVCDDEDVPADQNPELSITKTATEQSYSAVGDIINYTIVATNIGNTTLDNVTVTDPGVDGLSCNPANGSTLAPSDSMTCTATHTITQADIDAGNYLNTACVDDGPDGAAEVCDDEDVPADQNPELSITKTATEQSYSAVGDIINYTIVATNIGNTTLDNVTVTDPGVDGLSCNPANGSTLAPSDSMTCTATHTITQADIDAGNYLNTACVDDGPDGAAEVCDDEDVPADQNPELSITKTATEQSYSAVGDIINYTIVATNIGNTTLDNVTVTDPGVDGLSCNPANGSTLAPSDSMTCTATHTITQADIDAGNYLNTACVDDGPDGAAEVCDDEDVPADQNPELSITKTATEQSYSAVGDIINYTIVATNIGNTTLDNVTVTDPGVDGLSCNPANGSTLAPSDSMTCTATHTITQADIDAGNYLNTACVDDGPDGAAEVCDDEDVPADQNPELSITKTATEQSYSAVGDIINYTIVATNIGNTTLDNVTVTDPGVDGLSCNPANGSTLAPSDSMTCTATHTITQADIDAGNYLNTACVDDGPDGAAEVCDDEDVPADQNPELSITKTATEQSYSAVGDIINYTIVATNIGNTTLDNVTVTDPGVDGLSCNPANGSTLAPSDSMTCTATHTITQADIDAGNYLNTACVDDGPDGAAEVCDDEDVPADQNPELSITKTATEQSYSAVGDIINYTIVATNIGNTTLDNVTVTDPGVDGLSCNPANGSTLAPSDSMTCTATHTITQADIDAGNYLNTACVDDGPDGAAEVCDDEDVPADQNPDIQIIKDGAFQDENGDGNADVGETISYTLDVTNTGNVTLSNVDVTDPLLGVVSCPSGNPIPTLAVGATENCTGSYAVTQADIDAGTVHNLATTTGDCPDGSVDCASNEDDHDEPLPQAPDHSLLKEFASSLVLVDDQSSFDLTYTNTGNVTLNNVVITDDINEKLSVDSVLISPQGACSVTGTNPQSLTCNNINDLAPGETVTVTVNFTANAIFSGLPLDPNQRKGVEYLFVFADINCILQGDTDPPPGSHVLTCDVDGDGIDEVYNDVAFADNGGNTVFFTPPPDIQGLANYDTMELHLSCSEVFFDGWATNGGPDMDDNPDWRIAEYEIIRYKPNPNNTKECGEVFLPINVENIALASATSVVAGLPIDIWSNSATVTIDNQ